MRKLLALVAVAVVVFAATGNDKRYQVFGVAFYNLENFFDTINNNGKYDYEYTENGSKKWDGEKYRNKVHNMAYAISQMTTQSTPMGPAIIGVSEIENITPLQDLVKDPALKDKRLQIVHHDSPDLRGIDVALLYNPRFFRVLNVVNSRVVVDGYPEFKTRDQMCVTGLLAGEKVSVIVNHWPSRSGGQERSNYLREAAAKRVRLTVDSLLRDDPNQGIIIMGDLNDDPFDPSVAEVLGAKKDMDDVEEPSDLYNPWWETLDKGIGSLAYRGQWNLFDQIIMSQYFLGDRSRLTFFKNEVLNFDFLKTSEGDRKGYPLRTHASGVYLNGYSDHFPTEIFLVKEVKNN